MMKKHCLFVCTAISRLARR